MQKSIIFKLFHSGKRFQKVPFWWILLCRYKCISVDGRRIRNNKVAFSNLSGIVWTGPQTPKCMGSNHGVGNRLVDLAMKKKYNRVVAV